MIQVIYHFANPNTRKTKAVCQHQTKCNVILLLHPQQMGTTLSLQFQQALKNGDEVTALQLFHSSPELNQLNPNKAYGLSRSRSTLLHYAARRGLLDIYKEFLLKGGDPTIINSKGQTSIHLICTTANVRDSLESQLRADMLTFTIDYCVKKKKKTIDLSSVDKSLNSPLHLAATSGLVKCVEILVSSNVSVTCKNVAGQTPMDCLQKSPYRSAIGAILEPKMVFASSESSSELASKPQFLREESYKPYHEERLKQLREDLLSQCSDILGLSRVHSETLLHANGWSLEIVVDKWMEDPKGLYDQVGIEVPADMATNIPEVVADGDTQRQSSLAESDCEICFEVATEKVSIPCGHVICKMCWEEYLKEKINSGKVSKLICPSFNCSELVPALVIMSLVPDEIYKKYLKFGLDNFVSGKSDIKWCPHPGCERAVQVPTNHGQGDQTRGSVSQVPATSSDNTENKETPIYRNVDCGLGHFFCWSCSKTAHDPCSCETWAQWEKEVKERLENKKGVQMAVDMISDEVWVGENCKPCPSCKAPIYKDDGCNHMTCYKCHHEFCWVCRGRWLFHGDWTGGYFECNNYIQKKLAKRKMNKAKSQAQKKAKKKHGRYFKHVYDRYKNHLQSLDFELAILEKADEKMTKLRASTSTEEDVTFFEDAARELLKCRHVLKGSYALSYFIHNETGRTEFIKLLADLEGPTELLAQSVNRPHLQTPKDKIILLTLQCREQRRSFLPAGRKLNPTEVALKETTPSEPFDPIRNLLELNDLMDLNHDSDSFSNGSDSYESYPSDYS